MGRFITGDDLEHLVAGGIAGGVARLAIAPLDLIKIRFQVQGSARSYTGIVQSIRSIYGREGLRGFWKGNLAAECMVVPYVAIQFATFKLVQGEPHAEAASSPFRNLAAGCVAGVAATILTYPLDLFRTRMAAQEANGVRLMPMVMDAWRRGRGMPGLYRGLWPTLVGIAPYAAIQFTIYEELKRAGKGYAQGNPQVESGIQFAAGFIAGLTSKIMTMPFDVIKKRFQVDGISWSLTSASVAPRNFRGVWHCGQCIVREESLTGLFKGTAAGVLKAAPNSAITFATFELVMIMMRRLKTGSEVHNS